MFDDRVIYLVEAADAFLLARGREHVVIFNALGAHPVPLELAVLHDQHGRAVHEAREPRRFALEQRKQHSQADQ